MALWGGGLKGARGVKVHQGLIVVMFSGRAKFKAMVEFSLELCPPELHSFGDSATKLENKQFKKIKRPKFAVCTQGASPR